MAAHNAERYLRDAIASILGQTLRDFELIVVDDGSTDATPGILAQFAEQDSRIRIMRHDGQKACGLTRSLIAGTARVRGRFIARMDADDVAEPERFAKQVAFLSQHPNCVAVGCWLTLIDPDGDPLADRSVPSKHEEIVLELFTGNGAIPHPSAMIGRRAFEQVGGYRAQFSASQDLDLWLRLAEIGELANLTERLLRYRLHDSSVTTQNRDAQLACAQQAVRDALERRGDPQAKTFEIIRSDSPSRARTLRRWARMALQSRRVDVARKHALSAFRHGPLNPSHWWLLARTFV
jgi:glycosyltransferase involved in cell wall biosynthesis